MLQKPLWDILESKIYYRFCVTIVEPNIQYTPDRVEEKNKDLNLAATKIFFQKLALVSQTLLIA